jgi:parvulin-like peptidyl-prolyl isomerase
MTELLERAIARVRALPDAMQDDAARMLLQYAGEDEPFYRLTPEEEADLAESDAEVARGEFATDEEIRAIWAKHGL